MELREFVPADGRFPHFYIRTANVKKEKNYLKIWQKNGGRRMEIIYFFVSKC